MEVISIESGSVAARVYAEDLAPAVSQDSGSQLQDRSSARPSTPICLFALLLAP